ncbi:uncharacterized protein EV422DRAFT_68723 [Fimicolochytrium jonesii]|uniref:uncharacterized protein n=1 Tax=Fimicolochytrium jonesii TaxID=1396493 RepID=UPI0022FF15D5|nr:uncharacterized protein EV422DRAFT_68723 [Fimicolochytrium jonesii]KAI8820398.1 hypothetical protein EV422DRAFT_68723 [Fimicolochytrium jonesii]
MGFFENLFSSNDAQDAHAQVYGCGQIKEHHKSSFTHEVIAGAAGFEAMKAYEKHVAQNGAPPSHEKMKELLAGFAAAEVDKQFETKGIDWLDRDKAKKHAIAQAHKLADEQYGSGNFQPTGYFQQQNQDVYA